MAWQLEWLHKPLDVRGNKQGTYWESEAQIIGLNELLARLRAVGVYTADGGLWGRTYADLIRKALEKATRTWKNKPAFDVRARSITSGPVIVSTQHRVFGYVNAGTRAHWIRPRKRGGTLAFNTKFSPKSTPGSLNASAGFSGPPVGFASEVWHPGTEARRFDETAARESQEEGSRIVIRNIMDRWGGKLE